MSTEKPETLGTPHKPLRPTLWELAADPKFNPATTGLSLIDSKPFGWGRPGARFSNNAIAHRTRCRVMGCSVTFAPGGVCGYCRHFIKEIRAGRKHRVPVRREAA